jgi:hypothetical protein
MTKAGHTRNMHTITHNESTEREAYLVEKAELELRSEPEITASDSASVAIANHVAVDDNIENLVVRIAGSDEGEKIDDLAARAGGVRRPSGALMLAAVDGTVLAAASMSRREAVHEPTLSGLAARAVVEYTLADLERRRRIPRRAA